MGTGLMKIAAATIAAVITTAPAFAEDVRTPIYPKDVVPLAPYSPGIKVANGTLYVSGNIPFRNGGIPEHARDGKNDIADQAQLVMENIKTILDEAGYTFNDAAAATVYLSDMRNYGGFNEVYATFWKEGEIPPARVAVEVSELPFNSPEQPVLVEVSMVLVK